MVFLYVMAGIIAFFALILSANLSVRLIFDSSAKENMKIFAKIGFYKIHIAPARPKKEKRKKITAKPEKTGKPKKTEEEAPKEKKKYEISEIFDLTRAIGALLLKRFKKHFKAKIYKIDLILAGAEAEKTAMLYGEAIQSAYYLNEFLERGFKIRKKTHSVKIIPDFSKERTSCDIDIKFYIRLSHMMGLGLASLMKFLKFWRKPKQQITVDKKE